MDARRIGRLRGDLDRFLESFSDCFARSEGRAHLRHYVHGQLSNVRRKCVEPMADAAGIAPRTLQDFLATHTWDHERACDRLQQLVAERHSCDGAIGLIDETSFPKRGDHTAGVQRQYCGASGKIDNCVVTVGLGYADHAGGFRCTLDHCLYLPESWSSAPPRRQRADIPAEMTHQPKWQLALTMLERAHRNGVRFAWLTFDEGYGRVVPFLESLQRRGQTYVAEVPVDFHGWLVPPTVLQKEHARHQQGGRPRRFPRLARQSSKPTRVDRLCTYSYPMRDQPWQDFHIKNGCKGPIVWRAKAARFQIHVRVDGAGHGFGLPSSPVWLIVAKNPLTEETKYFVCNAPSHTPLTHMLHVAFSRWHIERAFQDEKSEMGMDHFECRRYTAIRRHLVLTTISHLFLATTLLRFTQEETPARVVQPDAMSSHANGQAAEKKTLDAAAVASRRRCVDSSKKPHTPVQT
jgi:SRSO17 transposase